MCHGTTTYAELHLSRMREAMEVIPCITIFTSVRCTAEGALSVIRDCAFSLGYRFMHLSALSWVLRSARWYSKGGACMT